MVNTIEYGKLAIADLQEIGDYIEHELHSPQAASNTVNRIMDSIDLLTLSPYMGKSASSITDVETDMRILVCGSYLAFYYVQGDRIYIDRVIHSKRDYLAILFTR
ncbi:MAG: type II toxin-antitoxin system RelE/ParE family toxin [Defluviitaleaceae bacterium]|nr:type II toxin-antitoxin system RelE/ParE family toxin [Defluviitaleaceae bacterium]